MSRRSRVLLVVAVAAAAAVGVVGGAAIFGRDEDQPARPPGVPPVLLDLGARDDAEARRLRQGVRLHARGERARARSIFARSETLQAQAAAAVAAWPEGTLARLEDLARRHPMSGAVQFHLGLARFWSGESERALAAWRAARARDPDTAFAVRASDLLFRQFPPGLPTFVASFRAPARVADLAPPRQLAELRRSARGADPRAKLLYGVALQRLDRPVSARRQFTAAARIAPDDPETLVADAVGRFDKEHPERAFSRLGPLGRRFPRAATVRFHLGLLLLWIGDVDGAKAQLRRAAALRSPLAREADRLLTRLEVVQER
jgi:tetratricopeptide (TPR) repeat protein